MTPYQRDLTFTQLDRLAQEFEDIANHKEGEAQQAYKYCAKRLSETTNPKMIQQLIRADRLKRGK